MQRHSSGKLPVSAPPENASLPAPVITRGTLRAGLLEIHKRLFAAAARSSAQIALRRSGPVDGDQRGAVAVCSRPEPFAWLFHHSAACCTSPLDHLQHLRRRHRQAVKALCRGRCGRRWATRGHHGKPAALRRRPLTPCGNCFGLGHFDHHGVEHRKIRADRHAVIKGSRDYRPCRPCCRCTPR